MTDTSVPAAVESFDSANASPSKAFFVRMLTRDIDLDDALLDLLDNCVDGILRTGTSANPQSPYKGYWAEIEFGDDFFQISDNCGGIPVDVAKDYAFALGRPDDISIDAGKATVGMYGIGMKRAIFKMGSNAVVESRNDRGFRVTIDPKWMSDKLWTPLPMYDLDPGRLEGHGTIVRVDRLHPDIETEFGDSSFRELFRRAVSEHYALIIAKGFEVRIGTTAELARGEGVIPPHDFKLLQTAPATKHGPRIEPYMYRGEVDGVDIEIFAGLYRQLPSQEEAEAEEETRGDTDDAGWTVACNDRIVVWKDKSRLTGWGEAAVPNYHGQFIAISGLVLLRSTDKNKLPLTTTKRGLDGGSPVYLAAKELMREATKNLTGFTNKWKKFPAELESLYASSTYLDVPSLQARSVAVPMKASRRVPTISKYEPTYPMPVQETTSARISFVAPKTDIRILSLALFDRPDAKPNDIGLAAFEDALARATSAK